jgi:hypothetical protein
MSIFFRAANLAGSARQRVCCRWMRETRRLQPDVALDFQGLFRSALIARISGAKKIIGSSDAREGSRFFYTEIARVDRHEHAVDRYLKLAEAFGASSDLRFPIPYRGSFAAIRSLSRIRGPASLRSRPQQIDRGKCDFGVLPSARACPCGGGRQIQAPICHAGELRGFRPIKPRFCN